MSREHILVILGAVVLIAPFVGLPLSWLSLVLPVLGLLTLAIGVSLVMRRTRTALHEELPAGSGHE